jgi:S-adenosylmethionine:tRNA ribosyltransferase-isomerase
LSPETARQVNEAKAHGGRVIAVGTTSLRVIESAADEKGIVHPFARETSIFITPGYRFRAIDALLTNFHLPQSTLFMLVSAFMGRDVMRAACEYAIRHEYRFYSYGDASLLERA